MNSSWIDEEFPNIEYRITSERDNLYNCVAWAAGYDNDWWSHQEDYRWIGDRGPGIRNLVALFTALGYEECESDSLDTDYTKVALYAKDGDWTHAARQLPDGAWTSKLVVLEDIEHASPDDLSGDFYGEVHCIMRRRRSD
ncbi:MAG: hypothetical protein F4X34_02205 [Chloroflexi bacterium]|nr:hypothetical protein [Chloroflexota bacterium]